MLQETVHDKYYFNIRGYNTICVERRENHRGVITLIKDNTEVPGNNTLYLGKEVECLKAVIRTDGSEVEVYYVHADPRSVLELNEFTNVEEERVKIIAGDFTAHHPETRIIAKVEI